jgi:hypothetical protein
MIYVLGIDPGETSGWAFLACAQDMTIKLLAHGSTGEIDGTTGVHVTQVLDALEERMSWLKPQATVVAIERVFIPGGGDDRKGKNRAQAIAALDTQAAAFRWVGIAESRGYLIYQYADHKIGVPPGAWRSRELGQKKWTRKTAKAAALRVAKSRYDASFPAERHHVAEAIHIAAFAAVNIREAARAARAAKAKKERDRDGE